MSKKTRADYPKNWDEISLATKERDGWRCQDCGLQFGPAIRKVMDANGKWQTFGVHHQDRDPMNSDGENLISLCSACHCRAELVLIRREIREKRFEGQLSLI